MSRGRVVDMFRERAMLAVRDLEGSVVGFVGRDLTGDGAAPKYLNTGSTVAYCKGDHLLGLYEARLQTGAPSSPATSSLAQRIGPVWCVSRDLSTRWPSLPPARAGTPASPPWALR